MPEGATGIVKPEVGDPDDLLLDYLTILAPDAHLLSAFLRDFAAAGNHDLLHDEGLAPAGLVVGYATVMAPRNFRDAFAIYLEGRVRPLAVRKGEKLRRDVHALLQRAHGVEPRVTLVPPKALPQTSSGKLSRSKAKANYLSGAYEQFDAAVGA